MGGLSGFFWGRAASFCQVRIETKQTISFAWKRTSKHKIASMSASLLLSGNRERRSNQRDDDDEASIDFAAVVAAGMRQVSRRAEEKKRKRKKKLPTFRSFLEMWGKQENADYTQRMKDKEVTSPDKSC